MSLGAVLFHLRMYTKFPRARNRFHSTNTNKQRLAQYATVWCFAAPQNLFASGP
jgi:hypothetical protein